MNTMTDTETPDPPTRVLSYSRASSFLGCRKAYDYRYAQGLSPRVDAPPLMRGTFVDWGLCAAIVADNEGSSPGQCEGAAVVKIAEVGGKWLRSEKVTDHAKMAGQEWMDEAMELVTSSKLIAARAVRFLNLGEGRWRTLAIPNPDDPQGRQLQFGCQAKVSGDLSRNAKHHRITGDQNFHGHIDWVARDTTSGHTWLIDFKVRKVIQAEGSLEFDYQLPAYVAALRQMGVTIRGAAHLQIRAAVPGQPELLKAAKDGTRKMSRAQIATDWPTYRETLLANELNPDDYLDVKAKLKPFDVFSTIYRADEELFGVWEELNVTRIEIDQWHANPKRFAPRRLHTMQCRGCHYQEICLAELRGHDAEGVRALHYTQKDRT